jgi:hypothetical protein
VLRIGNDLKQIARLRVATGSEHAHQPFRRVMGCVAQLGEAGGVDEIAKNDLPVATSPERKCEERFLSSQADHFAGAKRKEKASACFVRNDCVVVLLVQVSEELALFGGEVAVAATVDFAFASEGRHFAEMAHGVQDFGTRSGERAELGIALEIGDVLYGCAGRRRFC